VSNKVTWYDGSLLEPAMRALDEATAVAQRLSTAVDRLEGESLEIIAALGLHEDTPHERVLARVRALVKEHAEMRMVMEGHRHRFRSKSNHHPKCDIPMSCQGGCWDLFYGEDLP
jgi:hypothetical protein